MVARVVIRGPFLIFAEGMFPVVRKGDLPLVVDVGCRFPVFFQVDIYQVVGVGLLVASVVAACRDRTGFAEQFGLGTFSVATHRRRSHDRCRGGAAFWGTATATVSEPKLRRGSPHQCAPSSSLESEHVVAFGLKNDDAVGEAGQRFRIGTV